MMSNVQIAVFHAGVLKGEYLYWILNLFELIGLFLQRNECQLIKTWRNGGYVKHLRERVCYPMMYYGVRKRHFQMAYQGKNHGIRLFRNG